MNPIVPATFSRVARRFLQLLLLASLAAAGALGRATDQAPPGLKSEVFDRDPGWEGHNNRIVPKEYPTVVQDFGYSPTNHAGKAAGEMGGQVWRAAAPAYYADKVGPKTLDNRLSASGTFALTKTTAGGGVFFGFFQAEQPGGGGRPVSSLGLHLDCEHSGARLAVRLITGTNQSCGTFITPFLPGKFRPTPIRNDGTRYAWTLDYDPQGNGGRGRFTFTLHSDGHKPGELEKADLPESYRQEARRRFPSTTTFAVDLPEGYRRQGTTFDHFGLMNMMKPGGRVTIYFDDLRYDGRAQDFTTDPKWDASGNRMTYPAKEVGGAHNFGFSDTNHAGGKRGEVGGTFWRSGKYAYYADRVGPLTLDDRLEARGKVVLKVGAPDSDMYLGWFNSANKDRSPLAAGQFLGVHVGGPTRVGHYFQPSLATAQGARGQAKDGPVLSPGKVYDWSLRYEPAAAGGRGAIQVTLGTESVTLPLKKGIKAEGAAFDRFGFFTSPIGGQMVKIYFDDLQYTAARGAPPRLPRDNLLVYRGPDGQPAPVKTVADWAKRRAEVVRGMQAVMGKLPGDAKRCALDVKVEEEADGGTYVRRLLTYASEPGGRVPAYLLIPKDVLAGRKKAPAVLCLHGTDHVVGHGIVVGLGKTPNRGYALELARRGYVTLAPNYPLLAKYQPDLTKLGWESGTLKAMWDNMRGLDLLASLPFVDHARGFGVIGHSLGGHNAVFTAVFDDRLKVVVSSCGLDSFLDYYNGDPKNWEPERGWCQTRYMRRLAGYKGRLADIPFDFHELVGALAPRHVLLIAPKKDSNFRADSVDRIAAAARPVFELYGHADRLRVEHPDCGHDFPPEMREAAYRLFDAVLAGK